MPTAIEKTLSELEYFNLKKIAYDQKREIGDLVREWHADNVVADIFEEDQAALLKQGEDLARRQEKFDSAQEALRSKADEYRGAVNRRDEAQRIVKLIAERIARITGDLEVQPSYVSNVSADRSRSDLDCVKSVAYIGEFKAALVALESLLVERKSDLVAADKAVADLQK